MSRPVEVSVPRTEAEKGSESDLYRFLNHLVTKNLIEIPVLTPMYKFKLSEDHLPTVFQYNLIQTITSQMPVGSKLRSLDLKIFLRVL
jgi:hypothetical protein